MSRSTTPGSRHSGVPTGLAAAPVAGGDGRAGGAEQEALQVGRVEVRIVSFSRSGDGVPSPPAVARSSATVSRTDWPPGGSGVLQAVLQQRRQDGERGLHAKLPAAFG